MAYAPTHEKELLDQSDRRRMGMHQVPRSASQQARTTEGPHHPRDPRCALLLRVEKRLSLAIVAPRFPTLGECLLLVQEVAHRRRNLGTAYNATRCASGCEPAWGETLNRVRASSTRSRPRLPGWAASRERIRRRQEGTRHSKRQLLVDTESLVL
jgi:hypothetical protein